MLCDVEAKISLAANTLCYDVVFFACFPTNYFRFYHISD